MKLTAKQYGVALYELTKDASKNEAENVIAGFVKNLMKNRGFNLLPKIVQFYKTHYNREKEVTDLKIVSARPLGKLEEKIISAFGGKKTETVTEVNPEILGGLTVQQGDTLFDGSLRTRLENLNKNLQK
ncbi:MAG: ATP synthase F1 subunit delta [bacterium]|nr:ATP synthase F1 subunit delta [bacterium]